MVEFLDSVIYFLISFIVFGMIFPLVNRWFVEAMHDYRIFVRTRKSMSTGSEAYNVESEIEDTSESIGLNQRGTELGKSTVLAYIARYQPQMIDEMRDLLVKAGKRQPNAMEEFAHSKINSAILLSLILFLLVSTNNWGISILPGAVLSVICGIYLGHIFTNLNMANVADRRKEAIEHGVPDLVDLLVICSESGLDLNGSIKRIARELRTSNPVLADEMGLTAIEMEMIADSRQVFDNLEHRTDSLQIKSLSKTLSQSIEYGSSLTVSLRELALESRQRRMLEAEAAATKAPTLLTLPMMVFIMPCLFIVMLGPTIVGMIRSFGS